MPKHPGSSRYFTWAITGVSDCYIRKHLTNAAVEHSQWYHADDMLRGYLYFPSTRPLPRKKKWIPDAEFTYSTVDAIRILFHDIDYLKVISYGCNQVITPPIIIPDKIEEKTIMVSTKPSMEPINMNKLKAIQYARLDPDWPDPLKEELTADLLEAPVYSPCAITLRSGTVISKETVELYSCIPDDDEYKDALQALTYSQRAIYDAECSCIRADYPHYLRQLIKHTKMQEGEA